MSTSKCHLEPTSSKANRGGKSISIVIGNIHTAKNGGLKGEICLALIIYMSRPMYQITQSNPKYMLVSESRKERNSSTIACQTVLIGWRQLQRILTTLADTGKLVNLCRLILCWWNLIILNHSTCWYNCGRCWQMSHTYRQHESRW